ncbi:ClpP/crotonase-like domain-containing protein [Pelagophyceae sp. CCMP2097]|nr:ClpP/crotonase-like domain-containing protein [Pelagophyceae sp. CCMP2097]
MRPFFRPLRLGGAAAPAFVRRYSTGGALVSVERAAVRRYSTGGALVSVERAAAARGGTVATIVLDDPRKLNALSVAMGDAFEAAVSDLAADETLRCVLVTGRGRAFSAGGDLRWLRERADRPYDENVETMRNFYSRFLCLRSIKAPTIACLNGAAVGAGAGLALCCDMMTATRGASLGLNFVRIGIPLGMGTSATAPERLGANLAMSSLLCGGTLGADALQRVPGLLLDGLLHDDTPEMMGFAQQYAQEFSENASTQALREAVVIARAPLDEKISRQLEVESQSQSRAYSHPDFKEAMDALLEKRPADFAREV